MKTNFSWPQQPWSVPAIYAALHGKYSTRPDIKKCDWLWYGTIKVILCIVTMLCYCKATLYGFIVMRWLTSDHGHNHKVHLLLPQNPFSQHLDISFPPEHLVRKLTEAFLKLLILLFSIEVITPSLKLLLIIKSCGLK